MRIYFSLEWNTSMFVDQENLEIQKPPICPVFAYSGGNLNGELAETPKDAWPGRFG